MDDQLIVRLSFGGIVAVPPPDDGITYVPPTTLAVILLPNGNAGLKPVQPVLLSTCVGVTDAAVVTGTAASSIPRLVPRRETAMVALMTR